VQGCGVTMSDTVPFFLVSKKFLIDTEYEWHGHYIKILAEPKYDLASGKCHALCQYDGALVIMEVDITAKGR
jgi:hypothetical protein